VAEPLDEHRLVRPHEAVAACLVVRLAQHLRAEGLRRLHRPQRFAIDRHLDQAVAHALDRLGDRQRTDGGAVALGGGDQRVDQRAGEKRAHGIVDEERPRGGRRRLEGKPHGLLARGAARDDRERGASATEDPPGPLDVRRRRGHDDRADPRVAAEMPQRRSQDRLAAQGQELLRRAAPQPGPDSPRRHQNGDVGRHVPLSSASAVRSRAKIMRPAEVWSALVTTTATSWPTSFRP
jgi:hypothetical protein